MILVGFDFDGIHILCPVQVSSHSGPTTRCAPPEKVQLVLSVELGLFDSICMALCKIISESEKCQDQMHQFKVYCQAGD